MRVNCSCRSFLIRSNSFALNTCKGAGREEVEEVEGEGVDCPLVFDPDEVPEEDGNENELFEFEFTLRTCCNE